MKKNQIKSIKGAFAIAKETQKNIVGGYKMWDGMCRCEDGTVVPAMGTNQWAACREACLNK